MKTLAHILAATDFSAPSLYAVDRGFQIAHDSGARYTLMHALGLDALGPLRTLLGEQAASVSGRAVEHQRRLLEEIAADPSRNRGVSARIQIEEGLATSAVPACAAASDADLILVGAHGQGFLQRLLLGSTASRLLRKSRCPVLVAKQPCKGPYRRALISVDFSPGSEAAIRFARLLAPTADLLLLHVLDVPFEGLLHSVGVSRSEIDGYRNEARRQAIRQLERMAANAGLGVADYSARVQGGDATLEIVAHEAQYDCDLLVMGKHGTHVTEELLLGSVTKRVLAESNADVLVIVDKHSPTQESQPQDAIG